MPNGRCRRLPAGVGHAAVRAATGDRVHVTPSGETAYPTRRSPHRRVGVADVPHPVARLAQRHVAARCLRLSRCRAPDARQVRLEDVERRIGTAATLTRTREDAPSTAVGQVPATCCHAWGRTSGCAGPSCSPEQPATTAPSRGEVHLSAGARCRRARSVPFTCFMLSRTSGSTGGRGSGPYPTRRGSDAQPLAAAVLGSAASFTLTATAWQATEFHLPRDLLAHTPPRCSPLPTLGTVSSLGLRRWASRPGSPPRPPSAPARPRVRVGGLRISVLRY